MAADSDAKEPLDPDFANELDDDWGDDWESAFQAEDFMLSPEEEADEFFTAEEGSEDELDIAALLAPEETQNKQQDQDLSPEDNTDQASDQESDPDHSSALPAFFTTILAWVASRPRSQKIIFPTLAILLIIGISATIFFRTTAEQLAQVSGDESVDEITRQIPAKDQAAKEVSALPPETIKLPPPKAQPTSILPPDKIRRKWPLPAFLITVQEEGSNEQVVARVDLTLVLLLEPGQSVPRAKQAFIRDSIFQFYANRPAKELRYYALARGEMIHNMEAWLHKDWPNNHLAAIIFNRYEIVK